MSNRRREHVDEWPLGSGSVDPTPWGGELALPTASGTLRLVQAAGAVARPSQAQLVTTWRSLTGPHAVSLLIAVKSALGATPSNPYASEGTLLAQLSGLQMGTAVLPAGVLRVTYGFNNALRVIEADLRAGSYMLPPCDSCTVEAFTFGNGAIDLTVEASVIPGQLLSASRFMHTWTPKVAAGGSLTDVVPFGARWLALSGGAPTGIGVGQPQIALTQAAGGLSILLDYANGVFIGSPGAAVELGGRGAITVANAGGTAIDVAVRFFLEA